jgi:hypothetical protein
VRRVGRAMFELFRLDDQADQHDANPALATQTATEP